MLRIKLNDFTQVFKQVIKKYRLYFIVLLLSILITKSILRNQLSIEFFEMFPTCIGVLFGGLITTVAIIFGILRDEDLRELYNKYGKVIFNSLERLKYHIYVILVCLFISIFSFFVTVPSFLQAILIKLSWPTIYLFYFVQVTLAVLTLSVTIEVIGVLFLIFSIKFTLITKQVKK